MIITLGKNGALVHNNTTSTHLPAPPVEALDTTAAGDVFNGALATALAAGKPITEAAGSRQARSFPPPARRANKKPTRLSHAGRAEEYDRT